MCNDISFWRQSLILATAVLFSISAGVMFAFPNVLNPDITSSNGTDIHVTILDAVWISIVTRLTGMPAFIILSFLMEHCGRKVAYIAANLSLLTGSIIIFFARDYTALLYGTGIQGISIGCFFISSIVIGEYCHPKRRGYFIVIKELSLAVGFFLCQALALICNWRQISCLNIAFGILSLILNLCWPETPSYLAMKGRFEECEKSYKWLNGNLRNRNELDALISTQKKEISLSKKDGLTIRDIFKKFNKEAFGKPFCICILLMFIQEICGRHYMLTYMWFMDKLVDRKSSAYLMIGGGCVIVVALLISSVVVKFFKRRVLLSTFGLLSVLLMFLHSLVSLLELNYGILSTVNWLTPTLLALFSFVSNVGVLSLILILVGEIFPLEYRGVGSCVVGIAQIILTFLFATTIPISMLNWGPSGTFLINGCIALTCFVILYFILPETKDKTLIEIECEMRGKVTTLDEVEIGSLSAINIRDNNLSEGE